MRGLKFLWTTFTEWICFRPRRIWYRKNLWWLSVNCWSVLSNYFKSVSINSNTIYISWKSVLDLGKMIVLISTTFSCFKILSNFNSLNILLETIWWLKAFVIFFIATIFFYFSVQLWSIAATTSPEAPTQTKLHIPYLTRWFHNEQATRKYSYAHWFSPIFPWRLYMEHTPGQYLLPIGSLNILCKKRFYKYETVLLI